MSSHRWRTRSSENVVAEVRRAQELFPKSRKFFLTMIPSPWENPGSLSFAETATPQVHLVLQCAGYNRLRNPQGDERGRLPTSSRWFRVRRSDDSEKHKKRGNDRAGSGLHEELQTPGIHGSWGFPNWSSRGNPGDDRKNHPVCHAAGPGDDSGFHVPSLSRNSALPILERPRIFNFRT